jgi:hypothetical protein
VSTGGCPNHFWRTACDRAAELLAQEIPAFHFWSILIRPVVEDQDRPVIEHLIRTAPGASFDHGLCGYAIPEHRTVVLFMFAYGENSILTIADVQRFADRHGIDKDPTDLATDWIVDSIRGENVLQ